MLYQTHHHAGIASSVSASSAPGGDAGEVIAELSAPAGGEFVFDDLDLTGYDSISVHLNDIAVGTDCTHVQIALYTGAGKTLASHVCSVFSFSSSGSDDEYDQSGANEFGLVADSGAYQLGNGTGDNLCGVLTISGPGDSLRKIANWLGDHGYCSGSDNNGFEHASARIDDTDPITKIVVKGSNALASGRAMITGIPK